MYFHNKPFKAKATLQSLLFLLWYEQSVCKTFDVSTNQKYCNQQYNPLKTCLSCNKLKPTPHTSVWGKWTNFKLNESSIINIHKWNLNWTITQTTNHTYTQCFCHNLENNLNNHLQYFTTNSCTNNWSDTHVVQLVVQIIEQLRIHLFTCNHLPLQVCLMMNYLACTHSKFDAC